MILFILPTISSRAIAPVFFFIAPVLTLLSLACFHKKILILLLHDLTLPPSGRTLGSTAVTGTLAGWCHIYTASRYLDSVSPRMPDHPAAQPSLSWHQTQKGLCIITRVMQNQTRVRVLALACAHWEILVTSHHVLIKIPHLQNSSQGRIL